MIGDNTQSNTEHYATDPNYHTDQSTNLNDLSASSSTSIIHHLINHHPDLILTYKLIKDFHPKCPIHPQTHYNQVDAIIKEYKWRTESNTKTPTISVSSPNSLTATASSPPVDPTISTPSSSPNSAPSSPSSKLPSEAPELSAGPLQVSLFLVFR